MATSRIQLTFICEVKLLPHAASALFQCKHIKILCHIKKKKNLQAPSLPRTFHRFWPCGELAGRLVAKVGSWKGKVLLPWTSSNRLAEFTLLRNTLAYFIHTYAHRKTHKQAYTHSNFITFGIFAHFLFLTAWNAILKPLLFTNSIQQKLAEQDVRVWNSNSRKKETPKAWESF